MNATLEPNATSLRGRDLLSVADLSRDEVERLFERAAALKADDHARRASGRPAATPLAGQTLAMLFQKPSLRTRVTFEAGMTVVVQPNVVTPDETAGVQTGELVLVGDDGPERLHHVERGLLSAGA